MSERFSSFETSPKTPNPEAERALESLEEARGLWIDNVQRLEELIPHNDVIMDETTIPYNVARNMFLANLMELDDLEQAIRNGES